MNQKFHRQVLAVLLLLLWMNKIKVIVCGDVGVGKTSILNRATKNIYSDTSHATIGCEVSEATVGTTKFEFWCFSGEKVDLVNKYISKSHIVLFVFDMSNPESLTSILKTWLKAARWKKKTNTLYYLIGNKYDINKEKTEATLLANEYVLKYYTMSAKTSHGVHFFFEALSKDVIEQNEFISLTSDGMCNFYEINDVDDSVYSDLLIENDEKKRSCCLLL